MFIAKFNSANDEDNDIQDAIGGIIAPVSVREDSELEHSSLLGNGEGYGPSQVGAWPLPSRLLKLGECFRHSVNSEEDAVAGNLPKIL